MKPAKGRFETIKGEYVFPMAGGPSKPMKSADKLRRVAALLSGTNAKIKILPRLAAACREASRGP